MSKTRALEASILIVEDRPDILRHLEQAVAQTEGLFLVATASTLEQGLLHLFSHQPRVVLIDIGLPDGSGIDLIRACASADWTVDTLVISIFGDEARVIEALRAGASGYVLKGGDYMQIGEDIQSVLDGGSPISPAIARHLLTILKQEPTTAPQDKHESPDRHEVLTEREVEILGAVARGYRRHEIARHLGISPGTVGNHITRIYRKLEVSSNIEAVAKATQIGAL